MTVIKDVSGNADPGTATKWGGNDIMFIDNIFDDIDKSASIVNGTGALRINTPTRFRSTKFILRDSNNDHNYIFVTSDLAANRNVTLPLLTADANFVFDSFPNVFTEVQKISKDVSTGQLVLHRPINTNTFASRLDFSLNDSVGNETVYARILGNISDNTDGSEDGTLQGQIIVAGTITPAMYFDKDLFAFGSNLFASFTQAGLTTLRTFSLPDADSKLIGNDSTDVTLSDGKDFAVGSTTGTKIGTATNQKLGFFGTTPVTQRTGIADVDSSTVDTTYGTQERDVIISLRTKLNAVLQALEDVGITAVA